MPKAYHSDEAFTSKLTACLQIVDTATAALSMDQSSSMVQASALLYHLASSPITSDLVDMALPGVSLRLHSTTVVRAALTRLLRRDDALWADLTTAQLYTIRILCLRLKRSDGYCLSQVESELLDAAVLKKLLDIILYREEEISCPSAELLQLLSRRRSRVVFDRLSATATSVSSLVRGLSFVSPHARASLVAVLSHVAEHEAGRRAISESDGVGELSGVLRDFSTTALDQTRHLGNPCAVCRGDVYSQGSLLWITC